MSTFADECRQIPNALVKDRTFINFIIHSDFDRYMSTNTNDSDFYRLANKHGTLKQLFTRNQFAICKEKLLSMDEVST
jgi:hypothetical protein